jgi:hypothetical protein
MLCATNCAARAAPDDALLPQSLAKDYGGVPDTRTLCVMRGLDAGFSLRESL